MVGVMWRTAVLLEVKAMEVMLDRLSKLLKMMMMMMSAMVSNVASLSFDAAKSALVGLSRRPTTEQRNSEEASKLEMEKTLTQGDVKQENSHPFTSDELSKAMTAATLNSNR